MSKSFHAPAASHLLRLAHSSVVGRSLGRATHVTACGSCLRLYACNTAMCSTTRIPDSRANQQRPACKPDLRCRCCCAAATDQCWSHGGTGGQRCCACWRPLCFCCWRCSFSWPWTPTAEGERRTGRACTTPTLTHAWSGLHPVKTSRVPVMACAHSCSRPCANPDLLLLPSCASRHVLPHARTTARTGRSRSEKWTRPPTCPSTQSPPATTTSTSLASRVSTSCTRQPATPLCRSASVPVLTGLICDKRVSGPALGCVQHKLWSAWPMGQAPLACLSPAALRGTGFGPSVSWHGRVCNLCACVQDIIANIRLRNTPAMEEDEVSLSRHQRATGRSAGQPYC